MIFELNREYLDKLKEVIENQNVAELTEMAADLYPADLAEIFSELDPDERRFVYLNLDSEVAADVVIELEEDVREELLKNLPGQEIAATFIDHMDSDDAADVIAELPEEKQDEVLAHLSDIEQAGDIVDLLNYDADSAGGLMATELISVNENLTVSACIEEIRKQAEDVDEFYFVYVIDDQELLQGVLPLKKLLLARGNEKIKNILETDIISVKTDDTAEEVAKAMEKYDLVAIPVVDPIGRLKGRITIDDVVDVIKEEAEKDYQMMSGISGDVGASDSIFRLTRARIPWLLIGLAGGIFGSLVIGGFGGELSLHPEMAFFIPMIAAMGGNVGIQSSSIIVQGLANNTLGFESSSQKLFKELSIALLNGLIVSLLALTYNLVVDHSFALSLSVSTALVSVVVFASMTGTFLPLALNKMGIDPAVATGPFITTTNDIIGMFIYFYIAKVFYAFF